MEPTNQKDTQRSFLSNNLFIFLLFIFLSILLGLGGYYLGLKQSTGIKQVSQPQPEGEPAIAEEELPIGLSLLKNPIINQWRGTVKGRLTAKDEDSIIIEDEKGNRIVIPLRVPPAEQDMTIFYDGATEISLDDIPLGTTLAGDLFTVPGDKNKIVGSSFSIVR